MRRELSKREISDIEEAFEDEDIDLSIKEGRSVDLTLTISLDSLGISQDEEITLEVIKVGGGWYLKSAFQWTFNQTTQELRTTGELENVLQKLWKRK